MHSCFYDVFLLVVRVGRVHEQRDVDVRLVDGKERDGKAISGRVEVRSSSGRYGSVCDDDFDDDDAR